MAWDTTSRTAATRTATIRRRIRQGATAVMTAAPLLLFVTACDEPGNWVVQTINKSSETVDCVDKDQPSKTRTVTVSGEVIRSVKVGDKCPPDGGGNPANNGGGGGRG
jgi:hypothetical protein